MNRFNSSKIGVALGLIFVSVLIEVQAQTYPTFDIVSDGPVIRVADFGAYPNDGKDDEDQINQAIRSAGDVAVIVFDKGIYNLRAPNTDTRFTTNSDGHIMVDGKRNITLRGGVNSKGEPATHFRRDLEYTSEGFRPSIFWAKYNDGIKLENLTFTNDDLHYSVGRIIDITGNTIRIEVLNGYPMDDNCPVTAANVWTWNPETQEEGEELLKVGSPSLTYASSSLRFRVSSAGQRQMELNGADFIQHVEVGEYISWHYGFESIGTVNFRVNRNVHLENVHIYNAMRSSLFLAYNDNVYANNVEIRPKNDRFAMSARDGLHASRNIGEFVFENLYVKGTRLDAFVVTGTAADVYSISGPRELKFITDKSLGGGATFGSLFGDENGVFKAGFVCKKRPLYFFNNGQRHKVDIDDVSYSSSISEGSIYTVRTSEDLPSFVEVGTILVPGGLSPDTIICRNSIFRSIAGSSHILFADNFLSDSNLHENIMYPAIRFGANPSRNHAGNNLTVSNSTFKDCAWEINLNSPSDETDEYGYINAFNANTQGYGAMDISNISILNNTFESTTPVTGSAAGRAGIILDETRNIIILNNEFIGIPDEVQLRDVYGSIVVNNSSFDGKEFFIQNDCSKGYMYSNESYVSESTSFENDSFRTWIFHEDTTSPGSYYIQNAQDQSYLWGYDENLPAPVSEGAGVMLHDYVAWTSMKWRLIEVEDQEGYYYFQNLQSNNYLKGCNNGESQLTQTGTIGTSETRWYLEAISPVSARPGIIDLSSNDAYNFYILPGQRLTVSSVEGIAFIGKSIDIYGIEGRKLQSTILDNSEIASVNISSLGRGLYIAVLRDNHQRFASERLFVY